MGEQLNYIVVDMKSDAIGKWSKPPPDRLALRLPLSLGSNYYNLNAGAFGSFSYPVFVSEDRISLRLRSHLYEMCKTVYIEGADYRRKN